MNFQALTKIEFRECRNRWIIGQLAKAFCFHPSVRALSSCWYLQLWYMYLSLVYICFFHLACVGIRSRISRLKPESYPHHCHTHALTSSNLLVVTMWTCLPSSKCGDFLVFFRGTLNGGKWFSSNTIQSMSLVERGLWRFHYYLNDIKNLFFLRYSLCWKFLTLRHSLSPCFWNSMFFC